MHGSMYIKFIDALISQIYLLNKTLHVSNRSSVHHQEFFTVHTVMLYVIQVCCQLSPVIQLIDLHVSTTVLFILYKVRLHVSTIHVVILRSLISFKTQRAVHTYGIPVVFTQKPFISVRDKTIVYTFGKNHIYVCVIFSLE